MKSVYPKPVELIPHGPNMCLLDTVEAITESSVTCSLVIKQDNIFFSPDINGIKSHIAIELMAQTIGVYAGFYNQQTNQTQIGLLLSVRNFVSNVNQFYCSEKVVIRAEKSFIEQNVGVFNCSGYINDKQVCSARLNTYLPPKEQINDILSGKQTL